MMSDQWHVLGAGSIGSLFACAMSELGASPVLLAKGAVEDKQSRTIYLNRDATADSAPEPFTFPVSVNSASLPISYLLVTTKAYDVHNAICQVAHRLNTHSVIVVLVNGMGFMEPLNKQFPKLNFTLATTTEGAYRTGENQLYHAGKGTTQLGQVGLATAPDWFSGWAKLAMTCRWNANIEQTLWQKLAINCAINPLTAKHRCRNGELAGAAIAAQVNALCDEIAQVSRAVGYHQTADSIHREVQRVIQATANNKSSMLQDTLAGRPTEIEHISGYFLQRAKQHAITTPQSTRLYLEIKKRDQLSAAESASI